MPGVWEHRLPDTYALFLGDADRLAGGTVLITHGGISEETDDGHVVLGRLVEVVEDTGEVVWDLWSRDPDEREGWAVYRSERIPTVYPAGYRVQPLPAPGNGGS